MVIGLLGNESPDSNRFTLVTPKPENGVRLQATLGNQNPTGLPVGAVRRVKPEKRREIEEKLAKAVKQYEKGKLREDELAQKVRCMIGYLGHGDSKELIRYLKKHYMPKPSPKGGKS